MNDFQELHLPKRYQFISRIGEGGMQSVSLCQDLHIGRRVAIKMPKNPSAEKRFRSSAINSAQISSYNVATTFDYIQTNGTELLVEEFIEGSDLKQLCDKFFHYIDPDLCIKIMHKFSRGLSAAHSRNILHRDLKPSNIMIEGGVNILGLKITDFGISKMIESEFEEVNAGGENSITGSQTVLGALPYMAPEMIESPSTATLKADVWSFGAIIYYLATGDYPYGTGLKAIPKITSGELPVIPSLFGIRQQFGEKEDFIWSIVSRCLSKNVEKRPTMASIVEEIDNVPYSISDRSVGIISSFRSGNGNWGDLEIQSKSKFFHIDSYYGKKVQTGSRVLASEYPGKPRPRCHPVLPIKETH
jgi:eukaryotic-like serine/threonine-protein kinase